MVSYDLGILETTTYTIVDDFPIDYINVGTEGDGKQSPVSREEIPIKNRNSNLQSRKIINNTVNQEQDYQTENPLIVLPINLPIEDAISTRITSNFENNFPSSIQVYNDIVLPTKETVLKELRSAANKAPKGNYGNVVFYMKVARLDKNIWKS